MSRKHGDPPACGPSSVPQTQALLPTVAAWSRIVHTGPVPTDHPAALAPAARRADVLDIVAALIAAGLLALVVADRVGPPRLLIALAFAFFVPGRAVVTNWQRIERWSGVGVSLVFSLAILTVVATVSLWLRAWHPLALFEAEAVLSLIGLGIGASRRRLPRLR